MKVGRLVSVLGMAVACVALAACGEDEEPNEDNNNDTPDALCPADGAATLDVELTSTAAATDADKLSWAIFASSPPQSAPAHSGSITPPAFPGKVTITDLAAGDWAFYGCFDVGSDDGPPAGSCEGAGDQEYLYPPITGPTPGPLFTAAAGDVLTLTIDLAAGSAQLTTETVTSLGLNCP